MVPRGSTTILQPMMSGGKHLGYWAMLLSRYIPEANSDCLRATHTPPFACEENLRRLLLGLIVTAAEFDEESGSARIIMADKLLLSLTPMASDLKVCWAIYEFVWPSGVRKVSRGFVVTSASVKAVQG